MDQSFRTRLKNRDLLIGTLVTLPAPEIAEILALAGFDWLFVDLEHSALEPYHAQVIQQAVAERAACILRVPLNDEIWIKKALDTGAAGIMVPQVNRAEDAMRAVRYAKYPPQGTRSVGLSRAQGYGAGLQAYLERANAETAVIIQVEHIESVKNLAAILEVEGLDAVLVGPYDLSASMGLIGQVEHSEVQAAIEKVRQACLARAMPLGIFAGAAERAKAYIQAGYSLIAASGDNMMLTQSAREIMRTLKG